MRLIGCKKAVAAPSSSATHAWIVWRDVLPAVWCRLRSLQPFFFAFLAGNRFVHSSSSLSGVICRTIDHRTVKLQLATLVRCNFSLVFRPKIAVTIFQMNSSRLNQLKRSVICQPSVSIKTPMRNGDGFCAQSDRAIICVAAGRTSAHIFRL